MMKRLDDLKRGLKITRNGLRNIESLMLRLVINSMHLTLNISGVRL
jgi:hypothetical protein